MSVVLYKDSPTIDVEEIYCAALDRKCSLCSYEFDEGLHYRVEIEEDNGVIYTVSLVNNNVCSN